MKFKEITELESVITEVGMSKDIDIKKSKDSDKKVEKTAEFLKILDQLK